MTAFFGEDYIIQTTDIVLTPSGGQFGPTVTGFSYDEFFGVGGETLEGAPFSIGGAVSVDLPFVGETELFRARLFGEIGARFGINISASLDPGSVDAVLPYEVMVAFPDLDPLSAQAGEIVDLFFGTTLTPGASPDAGFTTQFPSFTFGIDLIAELTARLAAELGALGANTSFEIFDFTAGTVIPLLSVDTNRQLANGDANPIEILGVNTPELIDEIPFIEEARNDAGEIAGVGVPLNTFVSAPTAKDKPKSDVDKEGDKQPEDEEEEPDLSGIDLGRIEVFVPNINTASSFAEGVFVTDPTRKAVYNDDGTIDVVEDLDGDGNNLGEGNRDDLAALTLDLDGIVTYATGGAFPPLELGESIGGSFGPAFFEAGFSYNLFDVELKAALPLEQEFTLTPKIETQLQFFEANDDGTKGAVKEVEVQMERKVLRFDETGTFRDAAVEARLRELADSNATFAQDIDLFLDFDSGITGAFTGQTASVGGRMIISRDGGATFTELFTNAADPIAASAPALGQDQTLPLVLDPETVLGYRLFIGSGSAQVNEDFVIDFDKTDSVYIEDIEEISQFITETPFLDELAALNLVYDADDTFVDVVTKSVPVVTNRTGLEFDLSLILRGLAASASFTAGVDLGLFTLETGIGFDLGPLFEEEYPLLNLDIVDIFNGAFTLEDTRTTSFVLGAEAAEPDLGDAIQGTSGNDTLMGSDEDEVFVGFEGDDTIIALGGDDIIAPGLGEGSIDGGAGSDLIDMSDYDGVTLTSPFSNGIDLEPTGTRVGIALRHNTGGEQNFIAPNGQLGDEVVYTSIERFRLTDRFDYLSLGGAALVGSNKDELEVVETLDGDDVIELFDTRIDLVDAGDGDDTVRVISILNLGEGGAGDPTYAGRVTGGKGQDELRVRQDADLTTGEISGLSFDGFENLTAESGATFLGGDDNANTITASRGTGATLEGRGGNDLLVGGDQADTLKGGAGADEMRGGDGVDTADYSDAATSVFVDLDFGGEGRGFRGEAQGDVLTDIERVIGSDFDDILIGDSEANLLRGGLGDDRLMAQAGDDALFGGDGDDLLSRGDVGLTRFGNVYDGGDGFDIAALEVRDSFTETGTTTGTARFTYKVGSTFSSSNETKDRGVTVSTKWTHHNHIEVDLAEDGTGTVQYIEEDADANIQATRIAGTATYSHATPRSIFDAFPPYRVVNTTYNNNITDIPLAQLDNDSISFTKSSNFSNTSGSGKITFQGSPPSGSDRRVAGTETLIDIEGVIASQGNDILNGNSQDNAFFGNGGVDLIRGGDGNDRLGFGEGQALADVFSFPGSSGVQAPGSDPRVFKNLVERLVFLNPNGTEFSDGRNDWTPVGKIQINASGGIQDIGSFLWGQGGVDTLDMRFDRGISFFPDTSGNFARVNLEIPLTNAPINNYTGETVFYGFAEWFNSAGVRQSFATTYGIENVIGSENDDRIFGDRRDNVIEGLDGADVLDGAGGFDTASYALAEEAVTLNFRAEGQSIVMDNARATISGRGDAVGDLATNFEAYVASNHDDVAIIEGGALASESTFFANVILPQIGQQAIAFKGATFDAANLGVGIDLDMGSGDDLVVLEGFGAHDADLGDGDDAATVRNIGNTIDGGAGNDTITVLDHEDLSLAGLDPALRVTTINGGEGEDTVIFTGGEYELLELTDGSAIVLERLDPAFTPENIEFDISPIGLVNVDLTQTPEFQAAQQTARDALATYELTDVEFVVINGERIRVDNPDPVVDTDKTLTLIEDQIDPFELGLTVPAADMTAGTLFEIVSLPQTAEILLADGTPLFEGDLVPAADMKTLQVVAGQNFDPGVDALRYRRESDPEDETLTKSLPEPVRGVALDITEHLTEVTQVVTPPVVPEPEIALVRMNPGAIVDGPPPVAEVQYADGGIFSDMPSGSMTVEFLFRSAGAFDPNGPDFSFLSYAGGGNNNELTMFGTKEGRGLVLGFNGVGTDTGYRIDQLFDRELHRISVTYDTNANRIEMFVDGISVFENSTASLGSIANDGYLVWGQEQDAFGGNFDANQIVKGDMGDIRIWDGVRSDTEIADNAFSALADSGAEANLAAYWQADPLNEGVMVNAVGDTHLTLINQPEIVTAPEPEASNVDVIPTIRMNTGSITNEYIRAAGFSDMPTGPMTIEFIYQSPEEFDTSGARQHLLSYAVSGSTNEFLLYADQSANGGRMGLILNSTQTILIDTPSSLLLDTEPHRLSVLFDPDADTLEIYIDGEFVGSASVAMAPISAGGSLIIGQEQDAVGGGFNPNESVAGDFGDIRIWDGLRSPEEISANALTQLEGPSSEAGLVANWQVDPENSSTVPNLAGTAVMNQFATPARASVQFDLPPEPEVIGPPVVIETITKVVDQQGDLVTITVDGVPTDGTVFYLAPDPAFLALGLTVLEEVVVAVGDQLTPDQLEGLFFRADKDFSGDPGAFTYTVRDDVSHRDLSSTAQADIFGATGGAARDGVASQTISFDVIAANDAPDVARLLFPISPGGDLAGQVSVRDAEGDEILVNLIEAPAFGTVVVNPDGSFTYQQSGAIDFAGARFVEDRFKVQAVETVAPPPGASGSVLPGAASAVETQVIRIINPDFQQAIVFDPTDPDIYFDENGDPINLGGLGTDDRIVGHAGVDGLFGFGGHDTLAGLGEGDTLDGGSGLDTADYSASGEAVVVASDGAFAIGGDAAGDVLTDIENLLGSAFADFLRGDGQANVLTGGAGADYIQGRGGDDTLNGGENDDLLEPGAGADTVDGGAGQDLLSALDAAGPVTINLGNVALSSAGYADKTLISIEGVLGVAGFGNTLVGGGGEDLLIGGDVADSIAGAGGADILLGLGGADTISGGAGDDLILGLEGDDVLTGDAGRDLFLFEPGDGADVVTDFELPVGGSGFEDRLFFSGLGLTFADLDIAEVGGDVVIGYGTNPAAFDGSVTVEGVTLADLVPGGAQPDWILVF